MIKFVFCLTLLLMFVSANITEASLLRIALIEAQATAELDCEDDFFVEDLLSGKVTVVPAGKYFLRGSGENIIMDATKIFGKKITIAGAAGKNNPTINKKAYYGSFRAELLDKELLLINNIVTMESYLKCVLPAKTMSVWPEEVIKAQAVTARTYAKYMQEKNRHSMYDLSANDRELPYAGRASEKDAVTENINSTAGLYMTDNAGSPLQAITTSSSGGKTESAEDAWGYDVSYLRSVNDYDQDSPDYQWKRNIKPSVLETILEQNGYHVGRLTGIRLSPLKFPSGDRTATGRVKYVFVFGKYGSAKISGKELQDFLGLESTLFDVETGVPLPQNLKVSLENSWGMEVGSKEIEIRVNEEHVDSGKQLLREYHFINYSKDGKIIFKGSGKGDGLGLSAWGARGLANAFENKFVDILRYYYGEIKLSTEQ